MLEEIYKYLAKSDAKYDFEDALVIVRLRKTLECCKRELLYLQQKSSLEAWQREDLELLTKDVAALEHVISIYEWEEDE